MSAKMVSDYPEIGYPCPGVLHLGQKLFSIPMEERTVAT